MEFETVKNRISFRLVNKNLNPYRLENIVHTDYLDLTFVYFIIFNKDENGFDTIMITNEDLSDWKISADELHETARDNFRSIFRICMIKAQSMEKFLMITTKYKVFGGVFLSECELLYQIAEVFDDDLCLIPSSIHEIIAMPLSMVAEDEINETIRTVNAQAVEAKDYLSDHMYRFSRKTGAVVM